MALRSTDLEVGQACNTLRCAGAALTSSDAAVGSLSKRRRTGNSFRVLLGECCELWYKMSRFWHVLKEQFSRIRGSLTRRTFEGDFDEEVEAHLALLTERFVRRGLSPDEARYAARRQFGGVTQMKNELWDRSRFRPLEAVLQDSTYVVRQFRKSPLFAVASILTLALGIGANTAIFTLVDQLILRLLPIKDPSKWLLWSAKDSSMATTWGKTRCPTRCTRQFGTGECPIDRRK